MVLRSQRRRAAIFVATVAALALVSAGAPATRRRPST
jgi:hypothetical protein